MALSIRGDLSSLGSVAQVTERCAAAEVLYCCCFSPVIKVRVIKSGIVQRSKLIQEVM